MCCAGCPFDLETNPPLQRLTSTATVTGVRGMMTNELISEVSMTNIACDVSILVVVVRRILIVIKLQEPFLTHLIFNKLLNNFLFSIMLFYSHAMELFLFQIR